MLGNIGVQRVIQTALFVSAALAVLITVGVVTTLFYETMLFFQKVPVTDFLFGTHWSPQLSVQTDTKGHVDGFGLIPLLMGSLLIMIVAMGVAAPIGLFSAIYLQEYAKPNTRRVSKPTLELLAGIPTVVYGFFAVTVVAPFFQSMGQAYGIPISGESALAAGLVMGIMIVPFVSSMSDDALAAIPVRLRQGALALGATRAETMIQVMIPAALPGIMAGMLLAISRAIGETMIVVMAAGLAANLTLNPLESVTTVTVQIVTMLVGDQSFDSPKTLVAYALGSALFVVTLALNIIALKIVSHFREKYD
jgi:phosphate transport system permease protein